MYYKVLTVLFIMHRDEMSAPAGAAGVAGAQKQHGKNKKKSSPDKVPRYRAA